MEEDDHDISKKEFVKNSLHIFQREFDEDDPHLSDKEFDENDNRIYNSLSLRDLIEFLEDVGYNNRLIKTGYLCYEHYKHIFHYGLVKHYDIYSIFESDLHKDLYYRYNSIIIDDDTNIEFQVNRLSHLFIKSKNVICIFIDIRSRKERGSLHTTLLIYRPLLKRIEHFDSCGVAMYGCVDIFIEIINRIIELNPELIYVSSKILSSLDQYEDRKARSRSLNVICGVVGNRDFAGWCQIWSLFMYEMVYRYPNSTTTEIILTIYAYFKGHTYKEAGYIAYNIIRGYYRILLGRINLELKENDLHLNSELLEDFDPIYVTTDFQLLELIERDMSYRIFIRESNEIEDTLENEDRKDTD